MKNYTDSDYALNRYSDGIVYRFADGSRFTVTLAAYLAENPGKTEADFRALKELSDSDYLRQDRSENAQTKKDKPLSQAALRYAKSPEDMLVDKIDAREEAENRRARMAIAEEILDRLTDKQRQRYLLYAVDRLSEREIADKDGTTQQAVSKSLYWVDQKIKKFLSAAKK
jgi:DNA-directed RNA polymerase specialized sigma subunit